MRLILILTTLLAFQSAAASEFDEMKALADQGLANAQFNLGIMYSNGQGVPVSEFEIPWFSEEGVPNNNTRAYIWLSMAKTQGNASAVTYIDILKPKMTPKQIATGQALATKCYESNYKDCD